MMQTQSQEKIDLLRMLGAEVHPVPGQHLHFDSTVKTANSLYLWVLCAAVAFDNPMNYNHRQSPCPSLTYSLCI